MAPVLPAVRVELSSRSLHSLVLVSVVLDCLAAGMTEAEIHEQYPALPADATRAALAYAAVLAREELYPLEPTSR